MDASGSDDAGAVKNAPRFAFCFKNGFSVPQSASAATSNMTSSGPSWRPMSAADLQTVNRIAGQVHASLPERPDVIAEKFRLFPQGCFIFEIETAILGYAISHPWTLRAIPPLDAFLNELPKAPKCLYLHDAALLPEGRGHSASPQLVEELRRVAAASDLHSLALVSVYRTYVLWGRFGFSIVQDPALSDKLISYGSTAQYMIAPVGDISRASPASPQSVASCRAVSK
jgi:hypothetical protein